MAENKKPLSSLEIIKKWKSTERNLSTATTDSEIVGKPDYENVPDSKIPLQFHPNTDLNSLGAFSAQKISNYIDQRMIDRQNDRFKRYDQITVALDSPEIAAALHIHADEICTEDQEGNIVHTISQDQELVDVAKDLFDRLGFTGNSNNMWTLAKNMCGYGDEYSEVIFSRDNKSIIGLNQIPRHLIERIEENGILKGFKPIQHEGEQSNTANTFVYYKVNKAQMDDQSKQLIHPFRVLHWRIATSMSSSKYGIYGESILDPVLNTNEKITLMEKAMLIAQVTRAPERRIFYIDVGNLPGNKAIQYANDVVNSLKKKKVIDVFNNKTPSQQNDFFGSSEDIAIPKRTGSEGNRIETLPQAQPVDTAAIDFVKTRLFHGLRIPQNYMFDDTFANSNTNFSSKSIPFAKTIRRLQRFILIQLTKLLKIELRLKGFDAQRINNFILAMNNPSNLDEAQKIEIETNKWNLITSMRAQNSEAGVFFPDYLIYKKYMKMSDEEIVETIRLSQLQMMGDNIFNIYDPNDRPEDADKILDKAAIAQKLSGEPTAGANATPGLEGGGITAEPALGTEPVAGGEAGVAAEVPTEAPVEAPAEPTAAPENQSVSPDALRKQIITEKRRMAMQMKDTIKRIYTEDIVKVAEIERKVKIASSTVYNNGQYLEYCGEMTGVDAFAKRDIELVQEETV